MILKDVNLKMVFWGIMQTRNANIHHGVPARFGAALTRTSIKCYKPLSFACQVFYNNF